jgi:hypothetical protein
MALKVGISVEYNPNAWKCQAALWVVAELVDGPRCTINGHMPKLTHKPSPSSAPFVQGGPLYQPGPKIARQVNYRERLFLCRLLISELFLYI